jgi:hypothetical protein
MVVERWAGACEVELGWGRKRRTSKKEHNGPGALFVNFSHSLLARRGLVSYHVKSIS